QRSAGQAPASGGGPGHRAGRSGESGVTPRSRSSLAPGAVTRYCVCMRKRLPLTLMFIAVLPALAKDDEARIKAAVEDRYKEWIAAASKKDAEALTSLYDENAVLMPKQEEAVIGKAAIREYYQKLVADPHYVPFTETFESNSFHVVGDIAIDTADFDGEA